MNRYMIAIVFTCCIFLTACKTIQTDSNNQQPPSPTTKPNYTITPEPTKGPDISQQKKDELETTVTTVKSEQDIIDVLLEGIPLFCDELSFNLGDIVLSNQLPEHFILNAYYKVTAQKPSLKYAYEIQIQYNEDTQIATCTLMYMPYKLGFSDSEVPSNTHLVYTLKELIAVAQDNLTETSVDIRIMNQDLDVDVMQAALQQVGYGYILCALNKDATQIIMSPTNNWTREECLSYIKDTELLADEILKDIVSDTMTDDEKILAVYSYVAEKTAYDYRYYTNKNEMPYESMTAYGVLKDNLAICGGYSWAVKLLLDRIGIECYNVTGILSGEPHMWNVIKYEGKYLYFDATNDRGLTSELGFRNFAMTAEQAAQSHKWEDDSLEQLLVEE